jgi:HAD superfamily hydrolase (TIGR01509 family)
MQVFYFDVGGVLIPDNFAPGIALETFQRLAERQKFDPVAAHDTYTLVQPSLDLGSLSLTELCARIGARQSQFEQDWLAMHPLDRRALHVIERLLAAGHSVGLATNFCRSLLDLLIESTPVLSRVKVCCSSDIGLVKPAREFFRHASEIMPARETVFIDDREVNVQAARSFGWTAIQARAGWLDEFERVYAA